MKSAIDLVRGGVGLEVVGGEDGLHPFRQRPVFFLRRRRKI